MAVVLALGLAQDAHAIGCHVPDRPTLGLSTMPELFTQLDSFSNESTATATASAPRDVHVIPRPCTGEVPSPTTQVVAGQPPADAAVANWAGDGPSEQPLASEQPPISSRMLLSRLDRPPRIVTPSFVF